MLNSIQKVKKDLDAALQQANVNSSSETAFATAWKKYQSSEDYKMAIKAMSEKGMVMPYMDNILICTFSAGFNSKS